jgi:hypothetical protein
MAYLEREHGLTGMRARHAWRGGRVRAHLLPHHESALWRARPESRYVPFDEPEEHDPTQARAEMLRRYLAAFGPATLRDMARWAWMLMPETKRAVALMEPLNRYRDERGREVLDVAGSPLPDAACPAPVRFLPKWDNVLLGFDDRTRVLPEPYRKIVIKINGDVAPTFLVDGLVAGIWRYDGRRVLLEPFEPLPRKAMREVGAEAARLEEFLADPSTPEPAS